MSVRPERDFREFQIQKPPQKWPQKMIAAAMIQSETCSMYINAKLERLQTEFISLVEREVTQTELLNIYIIYQYRNEADDENFRHFFGSLIRIDSCSFDASARRWRWRRQEKLLERTGKCKQLNVFHVAFWNITLSILWIFQEGMAQRIRDALIKSKDAITVLKDIKELVSSKEKE